MADFIRKSTILAAPIDRVWRALTDHREFGSWFRVRLDGPFVLGERTTGNITYPGYEHVKWDSLTEVMDAPHLFAFTWPHPNDDAAPDPATDPRLRVEFRLEPVAEGTRLTVTESGFDAIPAGRRESRLRDNDRGWAEQMDNIAAHVAS